MCQAMVLRVILFTTLLVARASVSGYPLSDEPDLPKPHIIIVGPTGAGKSSLANVLVGEYPTCPENDCLFPVCHDLDSCTKETSFSANRTWLGKESEPLFTIVDTPGFSDSDGESGALIEEMFTVLNDVVKTADVILLTIAAETPRFDESLTSMLTQLEMAFGQKMWDNTMIEISKFPYDQYDIDKRDETCLEEPPECKNETVLCKAFNDEVKKHLHVEMELPCVFIDSYSQKNGSKDDDVQQMHWEEETSKLWKFAQSTEDFEFKTIDEVLEENYKMKEEIETLEQELNTTKEELGRIKDELDNLNDEIDDFWDHSHLVSIGVEVMGDAHSDCDHCSMFIKIYHSNGVCFDDAHDGKGLNLDHGSYNDWQKNSQNYFLADCPEIKDVSTIHVKHSGNGGVHIKDWRIVTSTGSFHCDDGEWYDNSDGRDISCISDQF